MVRLGKTAVRRRLLSMSGAVSAVLGLVVAGTGMAAPVPPNPGDDQIASGDADVRDKAAHIGELTSQLADAQARLDDLVAGVELKMEDANKARVDERAAEAAAARAASIAGTTAGEAGLAAAEIEQQRRRLDAFAASSYRQGSVLGSLSAFAGASDPQQVLDRADMLAMISRSQLRVLDDLERARLVKVNKDSLARAAARDAEAKRAAALAARRIADSAEESAESVQNAEKAHARQLESTKVDAERALEGARANVAALRAQRERYDQWQVTRDREAQEVTGSAGKGTSGAVETVISRALSQLGVTYAWGGGNPVGPTLGIRDGGTADVYRDFQRVGFDCSGLMMYAFSAAGIELAHYTGYQYEAGKKVPLSSVRRGDLLFWQTGGRTHHVALYLGGGKMVEAPFSGAAVRVTPVRYGGLAPYAVRMF